MVASLLKRTKCQAEAEETEDKTEGEMADGEKCLKLPWSSVKQMEIVFDDESKMGILKRYIDLTVPKTSFSATSMRHLLYLLLDRDWVAYCYVTAG